jgi:hypothetical protein
MRKLIAIALVTLTGCAQPPKWLANYYDQRDPCQTRSELNRPEGYQMPNWCGAGGNRTVIYNNQGAKIGYIKP